MCKFPMLALEFVQHLGFFFLVICTKVINADGPGIIFMLQFFLFTLQNFANSHEHRHFWQRTEETTKTVQVLHNIEYHPHASRPR